MNGVFAFFYVYFTSFIFIYHVEDFYHTIFFLLKLNYFKIKLLKSANILIKYIELSYGLCLAWNDSPSIFIPILKSICLPKLILILPQIKLSFIDFLAFITSETIDFKLLVLNLYYFSSKFMNTIFSSQHFISTIFLLLLI